MNPDRVFRLAVYGSLRPGRENHHHVADISGTWTAGIVRGDLHPTGWGMTLGYPALKWRADGAEVPVQVLESVELPLHWARLDAFEGAAYRRLVVPVELPDGASVDACIYVASADPSQP